MRKGRLTYEYARLLVIRIDSQTFFLNITKYNSVTFLEQENGASQQRERTFYRMHTSRANIADHMNSRDREQT